MTAPAFSIPSTAITRGLAAGTHIPGAALVRDAVADAPAWVDEFRRELAEETDPVAAGNLGALIAYLETASREPAPVASRGGE